MSILIVLAVSCFGFAYLAKVTSSFDLETSAVIASGISGFLLFFALLAVPLERMEVYSQIEKFEATRQTMQQARENGDGIEGAAFRMEVAEMNRWLAGKKYYRNTVFRIYVPKAVEELQPIG